MDANDDQRTIDVNEMRDLAILAHGLIQADAVYTLYYDETQNVRRLHVTPEGLNVRAPQCFVLGGIAHSGQPRNLGFEAIRPALRLQPSAKEMKFAQIATGDFPSILRSQRLAIQGADPMIGGLIFIALCLLGAIFFLQTPAIAAGVAGGASAGLADFANAAALGGGGSGRSQGPQEASRQPPRGGGSIRPRGS